MAGTRHSRDATRIVHARPGTNTRVTAPRPVVLLAVTALMLGLMGAAAPPAVAATNMAVAIDAGGSHTCAISSDGTLECWGANGSGQAADQTGSWSAVSAGGDHACRSRSYETIEYCGYNGII